MVRRVPAILLVATVFSSAALAEILQQDARPITVVYKSGEVEHYIVRWSGSREIDHHEDGHPSQPMDGWFTDTRQCHWSIDSKIVRKVFLLNHNGQEYAQEELTTPLVENFANKGSDFVVAQLRPENCGDARDRFNSDVADSANHMATVFQPNVLADYKAVAAKMKTWPGVKDVQPK